MKHSDARKSAPTESARTQGSAVILYDGVCNLCNAAVRFVVARDQKDYFRFAPLQSDAGRTLAAEYNLTTDLSTFFLIEGGKAYERSLAWLEIMRRLGRPWSAFYFLKVVPESIRDWVYDLIRRNRYRWFGRQDSCPVPKAEWRWKFLA